MRDCATVAICLNSQTKNEKKRLCLRVTFAGQPRYFSAGKEVFLTREEFKNKRLQVTKDAENALADYYAKALTICNSLGKEFTFEAFGKLFRGDVFGNRQIEKKHDLKTAFDKVNTGKKLSTVKCYETACNSFIAFKKSATLEDITPQFMKDYEQYMLNEGKSKETIYIYARALRGVYKYYAEEIKEIENTRPFSKNGYKIPTSQKKVHKALTLEKIKALINYTTDDVKKQRAVDFFVFSCEMAGMNFHDILHLRCENIVNGRLVWVRGKTADTSNEKQHRNVKITSRCWNIIRKYGIYNENTPKAYIFPILADSLSEKQMYNKKKTWLRDNVNTPLKQVAKELNMSEFTTYFARHSFATFAYEHGATLPQIKDLLGHSDIKVTIGYIRSLGLDAQEKMADFFEDLSEGKGA